MIKEYVVIISLYYFAKMKRGGDLEDIESLSGVVIVVIDHLPK